ncbi:MAG: hypothetical protein A2846_02245 [Candidatus Doudnabacteria bacterium RIFCSPHIGHO2_01_FULL_49_9]|uniref:Response regulatory domain-containing protein n=1 Tax=Candidatus Doudnabacteria bacterium RIFCSPHIGHO2_01_FULL_49_9 TaxID=1817827 RepID=A0A1F5NZ77_9BACT|nr:MAG: hypothetical protein A2846_02245 [Candidatus Doudnabacteria bacterium RIFCSPHIGHO2_01_FULL_49_9]
MKILLLEPDEYWTRQFTDRLGGQFELIIARDTADAKHLYEAESPDMVVGELLLADGSSYGFLENLRALSLNAALPIVIFSQVDSLQDIEATLALGVSGYFVKGRDRINDVHNLLLTLNSP